MFYIKQRKEVDTVATLAEALINDAADLGKVNTMYQDSPFVRELPGLIQRVSSEHLNQGVSLNQSIAKVASENNYTDEQIQRICEESNNQVYMAKYASYKGSLERDVKFELATVDKVKEIRDGKMEKRASFIAADSPLDRLDGSVYDIAPEKDVSINKIAAEKAVRLMNKLASEKTSLSNSITEDVNCIAQTLISQEMLGNSANEVFRNLCKYAGLSEGMMDVCKMAVEENIGRLKEAHQLPESFNIELLKFQRDKNFSVGNYGFAKQASAPAFISIITENGTPVTEFDSLVKIASRASACAAELAKKQHLSNKVCSVFGNEG